MYRELEHTMYFVSNRDLTIDYHCFPNGFNTFLWASTASSCYITSYAINTNCILKVFTELVIFNINMGIKVTKSRICDDTISKNKCHRKHSLYMPI